MPYEEKWLSFFKWGNKETQSLFWEGKINSLAGYITKKTHNLHKKKIIHWESSLQIWQGLSCFLLITALIYLIRSSSRNSLSEVVVRPNTYNLPPQTTLYGISLDFFVVIVYPLKKTYIYKRSKKTSKLHKDQSQ